MSEVFDFGDGFGPVAAARHVNPDGTLGGWVAVTASVADTVHVDPGARVYGNAQVFGTARVLRNAQVYGNAQVFGDASVYGDASVFDNAWVCGDARVPGSSRVSGCSVVWSDSQEKFYGAVCVDPGYIPRVWGDAVMLLVEELVVSGRFTSRKDLDAAVSALV